MKKILIVLILLTAFFLAGCAAQTGNDTTTGAAAPVQTGEVKEFNVRSFQFGFDPAVIEVNQGDVVRITATTDDVTHGFAINKFGVNAVIRPGKSAFVEFTATEKGEYPIYCSVPCGSGHGSMRGLLIVK